MKKIILSALCILAVQFVKAQNTNKIETTGNVGIGTLTPTAKLHVNNSGTIGGSFNINQSYLTLEGGGQRLIMDPNEIYSSNGIAFGSSYNTAFTFRNVNVHGSDELMRIAANGNVGIGTTTPTSLLSVNGEVDAKGFLNLYGSRLTFAGPVNNAAAMWSDPGGNLIFSANGNLAFSMNNSSPIQFRANNKTGVLIRPTGSLEINNRTGGENLLTFNTDRAWSFRQLNEDAHAALQLVNSGGGNKNFIISTEGNVGIGVANPSQKLTVKGMALCEEIKVQLSTAWPDYVFASDYQLPSLTDVENYIQTNGHLPNIPSAADIKEDGGVELGDMNAKLLEKIEELTLYMIQQQKLIDAMSERLEEVEK